MIVRSESFYLHLACASVVSTFIFCVGFFPLAIIQNVENDQTPFYQSQINRSVLMIIDALRLDFIQSESFSYVHDLIEKKEGCFLQVTVNLPTVTKPRIKALTSGTIPSFLDVAMNFGNDEMKIDTFLHQLHRKSQKIVFAGDDTWKMFNIFEREYANRDSLFVNDFYQGDRNVTDSLRLELKNNDWKLLILHYLGLDHIGHVEGPFSDLVHPKLKEMNEVIKLIHENLKKMNENSSKKSILFVTGDHGMRDTGGHSGNSYPEIHIPLLMLGCDCESNRNLFYRQIDFASTFSILNGLPIPKASIGSIIPEMLFNTSKIEKLSILKFINERLINLIETPNEELKHQFVKAKTYHQMYARDKDDQNALLQAESNYLSLSRKLSDELGKKSLEVNLFQVVLGLTINILIVISLLMPCDDYTKDLKMTLKSFLYFIFFGFILKIILMNEIFEQNNDFKSFLILSIMMCILRTILGIMNCKLDRMKKFELFDHDLIYILIIGHFVYTISVASSSFVEEEHQIWYYLCSSIFVFLSFYEFRGRNREFEVYLMTAFKCFGFLALHVLIRRFNQTGDKWIKLPDVTDWLHMDANKIYLNLLVIVSLMASLAWLIKFHSGDDKLKSFFIAIAHVLVYFHQTRSISNRNDLPITSMFWVVIGCILLIEIIKQYKKISKHFDSFAIFFLLSLLLHQPQNVILAISCTLTCWFHNQACNRMLKDVNERTIAKIFLHFWTGKLFYFYQGNSNSLSTIDVNAGFVGQMHVHLPIIFVFSTINTFNGQLISLFYLVKHLTEDSEKFYMDKSVSIKQLLWKWLSLLNLIPATVFLVIITILRHHLFIWSVFSPKLLYDSFMSMLICFVMIIYNFTIKN